MSDLRLVPLDTLKWWRELVDLNPRDLAPRIDAVLGEQLYWLRATRDVLAERRRQIELEGWTPAHDDQHSDSELALAAGCYCESAARPRLLQKAPDSAFALPKLWPRSWSLNWWKPKDPRRDLVRAAALIIAEIERLDRAEAKAKAEGAANG